MTPVIVFPDAQLATRDLLRSVLPDRTEVSAVGVTVTTKVPVTKVDEATLPLVVVRSDGSFRNARLNGRATVRVSIWHRDEGLALNLAHLVEGLLLATRSDEVRSVSSVTGPLPTTDPDTGDPMAFLTVTVRLRPATL